MPRRKRTPDESGRRAKVSRVEHNEETLVISDSDQEEDDSSLKRSSRTSRRRRRENESQLQEMTEEEMLLLAMRLSAQEANSAAQRRQLEDSDIQKAIEESLHESTVKDSQGQDEAASSSGQPQQDIANTVLHLRRKLSYPRQDPRHGENERENTSPLLEMPDLSQTTSSHPSSRSLTQLSKTSATSQDKTSDKLTVISDTPEDELFKSRSESQMSPVFPLPRSLIRHPVVCVEKLSQELIPGSAGSMNFHPEDSTATSACADGFLSPQKDSPLSKWPVFTQDGFKPTSHLPEDEDGHQNANGKEDDTQIPDEDTSLATQLSQGLSSDPDTCLSPSRRSQISSPKCVPENSNEDVTETSDNPDQKQVEDQTTRGENVKSDTEKAPNKSWNEITSHMVLHLADDDDDDDDEEDDGSEEVVFPSPVKKISIRTGLSPNQSCVSSATITLDSSTQDTQMCRSVLEDSRVSKGAESQPSDRKPTHTSVGTGPCTISYYWGVPFCPMGQSPDEYTRVIMCQMEVYEKSLKEAQRKLLRKADWGQPVLPGSSERPFGGRRWKRNRAPRLSEDEEENEEEGGKEKSRKAVEEEREEERQGSVAGSQEEAEGGQSETYVVLSSPETKDEQADRAPFFSQEEPETATANKPFRKETPWDVSDETQITGPAEEEEQEAQTHEGCEEDEIVCPETQMSGNSSPELMITSPAQPQSQAASVSEVMEVEEEVEGGGASVAAEEMMEQENDPEEAAPPHGQRMECPMCSKLFPFSKIEMHAAFCNGEADQQEEQAQVVARRKRTRGNLTEMSQRSGKSAEMEKCFLCQEVFSPHEYPEHVDLCIKKKNQTTDQESGLLSALERTEQRPTGRDEPGPSDVSTKSSCGVAVTEMSESIDSSSMTSCPSNAFSPPSENSDCLMDSSKNSLRLSRKRKFKR